MISKAGQPSKRLIVIDGLPGRGKTTALAFIDSFSPAARILSKLRTGGRAPAPGEFIADYLRVTDAEFDRQAASVDFYAYQFGTDRYGFHRSTIDKLFASTNVGAVVVRNTGLIRRLQQELAGIDVVPVLVTAPLQLVCERLDDSETTRRRLAREAEFLADVDLSLYQAVLRNDGTRTSFEAALRELLTTTAVAA